MKKLTLLLITCCFFVKGCATVGMVPSSAAEVDFDSPEGKTGWSQYQHVEIFNGYSPDQIYAAAKVGLGNSGFSLRTSRAI